ncbi:UNVERIFIED_CONTAM: hypothetical protein H355_010697 [Colinus virginianus]|nr:hypothetical protein H355_010697 [Colinus virginianus]
MAKEIQKMKETILVYLDRSGGLEKFVHDCKKYNDSKQSYAVYRFIISINPSDVAELDATLGNYILHKPMKAAGIFQSVCFIAIKTLSLIEQLQTEAQVSPHCLTHLDLISLVKSTNLFLAFILKDKQIVEMIDARVLNALKGHSDHKSHLRIQTFTVFLRDELARRMTIGNHYRIIGIPACVQNGPQAIACMEVSSVQLCKTNEKLNDDLAIHSWSIIESSRLLHYSICLLPRGIRHPSSSEILPSVSKDIHGTGSASIQACSALLAQGGICYIGDLSSYKKDKLELLQSVVESRTTTLFIPGKKYGEEADQQVTIAVQTNFWSYVDVGCSPKKHTARDSFLIGQMDLSLIPPNLLDVVGLLVYNESPSCQPCFPVVHHVLQKAVHAEAVLHRVSQHFRTQDYEEVVNIINNLAAHSTWEIDFTYLKCVPSLQFILFARNLPVELSSEAENLIQGYYLASRRVRRDSVHGSKLSASALKILYGLNRFLLCLGKSALCTEPNAVFPFELSDENTLHQRDTYLLQCHHQLLQFIGAYGPGSCVNTNEE